MRSGARAAAVTGITAHQGTALAFVKLLTSLPGEREIFINGSSPPVRARLHTSAAMPRRFPLPAGPGAEAILSAIPRPAMPSYNQLSLAISSTIHRALATNEPAGAAIAALSRGLTSIIRNG